MRVAVLCLVCVILAQAGDGVSVSLETPQGAIAPDCRWSAPQPVWSDGSLLLAVANAEVSATVTLGTCTQAVFILRFP